MVGLVTRKSQIAYVGDFWSYDICGATVTLLPPPGWLFPLQASKSPDQVCQSWSGLIYMYQS